MAKAKKYVDATRRYDRDHLHAPSEAIDLVKTLASAKFDESVDLVVRLGVTSPPWSRMQVTEDDA